MSQFLFNGSSRMRNVTFARDHHKSRTSIIEDAQRQRLRREEDLRRTRAAQRLQRATRQWLAGQQMVRRALANVGALVADVSQLLSASPAETESVRAGLAKRFHTACWSLSYAVTHQAQIPLHGMLQSGASSHAANEEEQRKEGHDVSVPPCASLQDLCAHQQRVVQHYGAVFHEAVSRCAMAATSSSPSTMAADASAYQLSPLWMSVLSALETADLSVLLFVLLQSQGNAYSGVSDRRNDSARASSTAALVGSVVKAVVAHNAAFCSSLDEEAKGKTAGDEARYAYSLSSSSPAHVDRWPVVQALTRVLWLARQAPVLQQPTTRQHYAALLQPLLAAFPSSPASSSAAPAEEQTSSSSAFARACWECICAPYSGDEYQLLTANPLLVLLGAEEAAGTAAADGSPDQTDPSGAVGESGRSCPRSYDTCCALLIDECFRRTALDNRLCSGENVNGIKGGPLRARVLGRLVRLLPYVQSLVGASAQQPHAAAVMKRYLLSVSCLSERLCREEFFIEGILADHYAYNTGQQQQPTLLAAAGATNSATAATAPRSQYRLLSSYLFSAEGGLRLLQLLTAEDNKQEQLRLQALQQPTMEAPSQAAPTITEAVVGDAATTDEEAAGTAISAASPTTGTTSGTAGTAEWPTSTTFQQSPLEILCNVFAWPLFTFSKPAYSQYQQEMLSLYAKLVRTPQLLRRLWSLYWQSCEGLRTVLPPGPQLQNLCSRPVWGKQDEAAVAAQERVGGRRVPAAAAAVPLLSTLPRLPTWETHPRYPMLFFDPHPSLSIFLFTLLAHYVNVCDFAEELRHGGDTAVLSLQESYALILALKEIVHRAHMYGVVPDSNSEAVAHAACLLLGRLHIVNEADRFIPDGVDGLWMSVGMVAAEQAVASLVSRWDATSAAVEAEESATGSPVSSPAADAATAADAVALSHVSDDDVMFQGSRSWDPRMRYTKLLMHCPFLLPFPARALLLSALLAASQNAHWVPPGERPAVVQRGRVFVDAYDLFHDNPMSASMENIRFVAEDGGMEAGFGRGVYRECIVSLCKEGFAAEYGLFQQTADGYVYPSPLSGIATNDPQHLHKIRFLGAMVGRALRDGILQEVPFAPHFRNAILGRRNTLSSLKSFDAELYRQLMSLTRLSEEELQAVGMTFVYTVNALGIMKEVELVRGGAQMEVTPRNCLYYVHLVANFKLNREAAEQTRAFCAGLHSVIDANRLGLFDSNEVGKLFGGDETGQIDLEDWREHTVYDHPEDAKTVQVRLFWEVVESMTRKQQSQLLKFVTSMPRPPLLGFSFLGPPFKIQLLPASNSGPDHLPSAATCFSTFKLPPYRDYATARAKIIAAIEETGTFEFS